MASSLGLALATLGTETSGSILSPCDVSNLACIKPTVGLTSRALVIPISERQDTVGPMARTMKDSAYLLGAIAGMDPNDNYTSAIPFRRIPDYVKACRKNALKGKRIGIPRNLLPTDDDNVLPILDAFEAAIQLISNAGATIVDNTNFPGYDELSSINETGIVLVADFITDLPNLYLSQLATNPTGVTDLPSVRNFTQRTPVEEFPDRDTQVWDLALDFVGFGNTDPRFWVAYQRILELAGPQGLTGALETYSLDALILPTSFSPIVPAILGTPVVTVPMGFYPANFSLVATERGDLNFIGPNLPFGLSFLGPAFSEELLVGLGYAFEQMTMVREMVMPIVLPTTELEDVVGMK